MPATGKHTSCGPLSRHRSRDSTAVTYGKNGKRIERILDPVIDKVRNQREKLETPRIEKCQYEKIAGTRIEVRDGAVVRVVVADGVKFSPEKTWAVKAHLAKIAKQAEELARNRGEELPQPTSKASKLAKKRPAAAAVTVEGESPSERRIAKRHMKRASAEGRQCIGQEWYTGEVVQRGKGCVWVRLSAPSSLPEQTRETLRRMNEELSAKAVAADGDTFCGSVDAPVIRVAFVDVAEQGLPLSPGVKLKCKVFVTREGMVGGSDVTSA